MIDNYHAEIIKLPPICLVGRQVRYSMQKQAEGTNPPLSALWDEAKAGGDFEKLQQQAQWVFQPAHVGIYRDLNKDNDGQFTYVVGMFMKADFPVPEGFVSYHMSETHVAVNWFRYAAGDDIWILAHSSTQQLLEARDYALHEDSSAWCGEVYPLDVEAKLGETVLGYYIACRSKTEA